MLAASPVPVPGARPATGGDCCPLSGTAQVVPRKGNRSGVPVEGGGGQEVPLDWFIQAAGGEAATDFARSLGALVHRVLRRTFPTAPGANTSRNLSAAGRSWA